MIGGVVNSIQQLLDLSPAEKTARGLEHTPREIRQQPEAWRETIEVISGKEAKLRAFLESAGVGREGTIVALMGAGSSEYAGWASEEVLGRGLKTVVTIVPTTSFITHPRDVILEGRRYLFVHFARSGDSPESVASYERACSLLPESHHLVITCNPEGRLAKASIGNRKAFLLGMPGQTNDKSLVMTSSFSSMTLAAMALAHLEDLGPFRKEVDAAAAAVQGLFGEPADQVRRFVETPAQRIQFLGTGDIFGAMKESRLKVLEMTDGLVAANADTYLGVRHGPRVFINRECLVVASLSTDPLRSRYEMDLLSDLRSAGQGARTLVIFGSPAPGLTRLADVLIPVSSAGAVAQELRPLTDVVVGQMLGLFACLSRGLKPDMPSASGVIGRVVEGVRIHPVP
jgi:tagatose-6-phosphate ketose/aldose isomerase